MRDPSNSFRTLLSTCTKWKERRPERSQSFENPESLLPPFSQFSGSIDETSADRSSFLLWKTKRKLELHSSRKRYFTNGSNTEAKVAHSSYTTGIYPYRIETVIPPSFFFFHFLFTTSKHATEGTNGRRFFKKLGRIILRDIEPASLSCFPLAKPLDPPRFGRAGTCHYRG